VATVASGDDLIAIVSVITFESALDSAVTTTVFNRTDVEAVKSPRIGKFTTETVSLAQIADLSLWDSSFPSVNPNRVEQVVDANSGDFIYILIDDT